MCDEARKIFNEDVAYSDDIEKEFRARMHRYFQIIEENAFLVTVMKNKRYNILYSSRNYSVFRKCLLRMLDLCGIRYDLYDEFSIEVCAKGLSEELGEWVGKDGVDMDRLCDTEVDIILSLPVFKRQKWAAGK